MKSKLVAAIAVAMMLSACGPDRPPAQQYAAPAPQYPQPVQQQQPVQYAQAPQPVIIQQAASPAHSGFNTGDAAIGALAGAAAMHAMSNRPAAVQPTYAPRPSYQPRRVVTTTVVRNSGGRTVTRTTSRRR